MSDPDLRHEEPRPGQVAIIAAAGRFPGAEDVEAYWRNLVEGVESVTRFTREELRAAGVPEEALDDPAYVPARACLEGYDLFDASRFGFTAREAEVLDPQHRVFLECAAEALDRAGYGAGGPRIGVYAGCANSGYLANVYTNPEAMATLGGYQVLLANDKDFLATRASFKLDLGGPSVTVQTACSSSLVAVHLACQSLTVGECDMALAGGVALTVPERAGYTYQEHGIASPDGHCRAFDAEAAGTVSGSGVGLVVLKRLDDALADGDRVLAVILGSAVNNDGAAKMGYSAPSVQAQSRVIAEAHAVAGVDAAAIGYVEAHGTGTALGDPVEVAALTRAFRLSPRLRKAGAIPEEERCWLGSVKTNIGHLDAAAGVAGLIKASLALEREEIPATLHFETPNPQIDFAGSPFRVIAERTPWPRTGAPRRAGLSSLGIGGTNVHLVLEEAPVPRPGGAAAAGDSAALEGAAAGEAAEPVEVLVLSAHGAEALEEAAERLADHLEAHPDLPLADVAYTLQVGRRLFPHRSAVLARGRDQAVERLRGGSTGSVLRARQESRERPVVFLLPGQGAQHPGMARELYGAQPVFARALDRCAAILEPLLELAPGGFRRLLWPGEGDDPEAAAEALRQTAIAQPALVAVEWSLAQLWIAWGVTPRALLGHSVGEYTAACLAGVLGIEDTLALVVERGRLIQDLPGGAMVAVHEAEEALAERLGPELSVAAVNAPGLCVASGPEEAVAALEAELSAAGVEHRRLHTSHAFHSPMMDPILQAFEERVARIDLRPPRIPVISNRTGHRLEDDEATDPAYWRDHLRHGVRFAAGLETLAAEPELVLLEVGPGRTLASLVRRQPAPETPWSVLSSLDHATASTPADEAVAEALARLWLSGVTVDWDGVHGVPSEGVAPRRRRVPLPPTPFERRRYWLERRPELLARALTGGAPGRRRPPSQWFYLPQWKQAAPLEPTPRGSVGEPAGEHEPPAPWLLVTEGGGLGAALAAALGEGGAPVVTVGPSGSRPGAVDHELASGRPGAWDDLLAELMADGPLAAVPAPRGVVYLRPAEGEAPAGGSEGFAAAQERGFYGFLAMARALGRRSGGERLPLLAVTRGAQSLGDESPAPEGAPLLTLCRVVAQEIPNLVCRTVDLGPGPPPAAGREARDTRDAGLLAAELLAWERAAAARLVGDGDAEGGSAPAGARSSDLAPAEVPSAAYRGRQRWIELYEPVALERPAEGQIPVRPGGTYLITGGLGQLGLRVAAALHRWAGPEGANLVLVGRRPLAERGTWPQVLAAGGEEARRVRGVQALEAAGAWVMTASADVADRERLVEVLEGAFERFGTLHGVIHAAGSGRVGAAGLVEELDRVTSEEHFIAKAYGMMSLDQALDEVLDRAQDPAHGADPEGGRSRQELDFAVSFSSLSAILGGLGYGAYGAANRFLDAYAEASHARGGRRWLSIAWDGWNLGSDPAGEATAEGAGEAGASPRPGIGAAVSELALGAEEGLDALGRALAGLTGPRVVISTGDLEERLDQWVRLRQLRGGAPGDGAGTGGRSHHSRPDLPVPYEAPRSEVEEALAEIWAELLGIEPVGIHDDFFELGGHSLLGIQLNSRLRSGFGLDLPLGELFEKSTIAELAELVEAVMIEQIEGLSEAQVLELLGEDDLEAAKLEETELEETALEEAELEEAALEEAALEDAGG